MFSSLFGRRSQKAADRKNPLAKLGGDSIRKIVINDKDRKKRSRERWNFAISASDPEFLEVEADFASALTLASSKESVQSVLDKHFTAFEKKLITPVDKRRHPQLYKIQRLNRKRYLLLLRSPRFADRKATTSLPFKLTLLYYGLPVAPMGIGFKDRVEEDIRLDSTVDQDSPDEEPVKEEMRPLRFLNAYQNRMWGVDSLRRRFRP